MALLSGDGAGDYWTLAILYCLRDRAMRFGEFEREMGINPVTLTSRLKVLTRNKLLSRRKSASDKQAVSYELTKLGRRRGLSHMQQECAWRPTHSRVGSRRVGALARRRDLDRTQRCGRTLASAIVAGIP